MKTYIRVFDPPNPRLHPGIDGKVGYIDAQLGNGNRIIYCCTIPFIVDAIRLSHREIMVINLFEYVWGWIKQLFKRK